MPETITKTELQEYCVNQARKHSVDAEATWQAMQDKSKTLTDEQYEAMHIAHSALIGKVQALRDTLEHFNSNEQRDYGCVCSQGEVMETNYDE